MSRRADQFTNPPGPNLQNQPGPWSDGFSPGTMHNARLNFDPTTVPGLPFVFPTWFGISGGFRVLTTVVDRASVPAGMSAWYPLINYQPQQTEGAGVIGVSLRIEASSCDTTGSAGDPWGTINGLGCAVIVGTNLPLPLGLTTGFCAPCSSVAVEPGLSAQNQRDFLAVYTFPPGTFNNAGGAGKFVVGEDWPPFIIRVPPRGKIQAAFVLNRAQANASLGLTESIGGYLNVRLRIGTLNTMDYFPTGLAPGAR